MSDSLAVDTHTTLPHKFFELDVTHVSVALAIFGAYWVAIGPLSNVLKEKMLLSSALIVRTFVPCSLLEEGRADTIHAGVLPRDRYASLQFPPVVLLFVD